jgi:hypothetical protein
VEKFIERLLKAKTISETVECPPVNPDKNRGNGGQAREYLAVFHTNTMRECR